MIEQKSWYRYTLYILLVVAAGAAGFYTGKGRKEVQIVEKKGETITKVVTRTVTVTKTVRPDGTVEEKTETKDRTKDETEKVVNKDTTTKPMGTDYSLGVRYRVSSFASVLAPGPQNFEAEVGRRVLGDIWVTGGAGLGGITLGVRYDF